MLAQIITLNDSMSEFGHITVSLLLSIALGAMIGAEREFHSKPAGLRTNILICMGAAIFTILSRKIAAEIPGSDPARITAQIVTGVGFIGAGAIMRGNDGIVGLTTAAVIWLAASVGAACGAGYYSLAVTATVLSVACLVLLHPVDTFIKKRHQSRLNSEINQNTKVNT